MFSALNAVQSHGDETIYLGKYYERIENPTTGQVTHRYTIDTGGHSIQIERQDNSNQDKTHYLLADNLGSTNVIVDTRGQVTQRLAFDPWGMRLNTGDNASVNSVTNKGYTGHETDDETGLINMNARVYDPLIGRFLSADPVLPDASNMASYNRYSYVRNNPLKYIDPTGNFECLNVVQTNGAGEIESIDIQCSGGGGGGGIGIVLGGNLTAFAFSFGGGGNSGPGAVGLNSESFDDGFDDGFDDEDSRGACEAISGCTMDGRDESVAKAFRGNKYLGGFQYLLRFASFGFFFHEHGRILNARFSDGHIEAFEEALSPELLAILAIAKIRKNAIKKVIDEATKKGGGKNAKHANQKKRDVASKNFENAKSEFEALKSTPNKTKDIKRQMEKARKAMEKARRDKDFTGEHHSSNAKGNR